MKRPLAEADSRALSLSVRLFERLLAVYPQAHRRAYGPAMVQVFRDQCRDAWRDGRGWGLTWLWLRVLPDLVKTSVLEHVSTLNERKTMLERLGTLLRPRFAPHFVFFAVSIPVFLLVVATSTLITFKMPELYSSAVRIKPDWTVGDRAGQLEFESIQSDAVLGKVIDNLDLTHAWGKQLAKDGPLKPADAMALLKARIDLRPVRGTSLIEIRVFSQDRAEAARLANAIADTYRDYRSGAVLVEIVHKAVPGLRPVRPNKPMNITLGILGGMLFALAAGAAVAGLAAWIGRRSRGTGTPPTTGTAAPPDLPKADGPHAKSTLDKVTGILWMGTGGLLFGLALLALVWLMIFQQASVTPDLLCLPVFGLFWACNIALGFALLRGKPWARICLGMEGVLFLAYYGFRYGFLDLHLSAMRAMHSSVWVGLSPARCRSLLAGYLSPSR